MTFSKLYKQFLFNLMGDVKQIDNFYTGNIKIINFWDWQFRITCH